MHCRFLNWLILTALFLIAGCGGEEPLTIPVSGKITFAGGACPAEGTIVFSPVAVEHGRPRRRVSRNLLATEFSKLLPFAKAMA